MSLLAVTSRLFCRSLPSPVSKSSRKRDATTLRYVDVGEDQKRDAIAAVFGRGSHVAADASELEPRSLGT